MILQRTRKSPTRPDTEVSQTFNSGVVQIFSTRDAAPVGHSPVVECTAKCTLRYEEHRIDTVQAVRSWPPALDLALRAVEHDYDNSLQEGTKDDVV